MVPNVLTVANGKGGVFKTSLVANVAFHASLAGWRVLAVDTDPQGNLGLDFGVAGHDHGESLSTALTSQGQSAPVVLTDIRPGLDFVAGGEALATAAAGLANLLAAGEVAKATRAFEMAIGPLAGQYNLILVDTPPGDRVLLRTVFAASRAVVIPTRADVASRQGIDRVARSVLEGMDTNPDLTLLGVLMVGLDARATRMNAQARSSLENELQGLVPVLNGAVRNAAKAAVDGRERGQLAAEYEAAAALDDRTVAQRIAEAREGNGSSFSQAASGLADDYQHVTNELLREFAALSQKASTS